MAILQTAFDGLSVAATLIVVALGLAIIFGIMKVINMAHGELIMIGAYVTYLIYTVAKLPFIFAMVAAFIVSGVVGLFIELIVIKRLYGRPLETLLATFGVSIMLQQLIKIIFGPSGKPVSSPISETLMLGGIVLPYYRLFIIIVAIALTISIFWVMNKTTFGIKLRTTSENRNMSNCLGINTSRIDTLTFALGSGLAGIGGALLAPINNVVPTMGAGYLVDSFMAVVLGGVGSLGGTAFGAVIIGEGNKMLNIIANETFAKVLILLAIIVIIRFRPEGLFKMERR